MFSTVKGIYDNGKITLEESPEIAGPVEVLVTFTRDIAAKDTVQKKKRMFGFAKGTVLYMSQDFNDPLEDLKDYM